MKGKKRSVTEWVGDVTIPGKQRVHIERKFRAAGLEMSPYVFFGRLTFLVLALALILDVILIAATPVGTAPIITIVLVFIVLVPVLFFTLLILGRLGARYLLSSRIYRRVSAMEEEFPEFLAELSLNLKSGQDLEDALSNAANEGFGILGQEIAHVATKINLGFDMNEAIDDFIADYPSDVIDETFELLIISWRRGTNTPKLLDRVVSNLKILRNMRDKITASVANYKIFLATVTVVIAPAMMALAFYIIDLIRNITTEVMQVTQNSILPFTIQAVRFNDTHFIWFSVITLVVIASFTAIIISFIEKGDIRGSTKRLLTYCAGSLVLYYLFLLVFAGFFTLFTI